MRKQLENGGKRARPTLEQRSQSILGGVASTPSEVVQEPWADFLIVTALREERDAVLKHLHNWHQLPKRAGEVHTYYEAAITSAVDGSSYRVVVTMLLRMGPIQAAAQTVAAVADTRPQIVIMAGIAGGLVGEAELGDVLVADQVADLVLPRLDGHPG